jgi:hypothetical protein
MFLDFIASQLGFLEYNEGTSLGKPPRGKKPPSLE